MNQVKVANEEEAYAVLRSVFHVLRDRLTVNQAVNFGAQLPLLLSGLYYEGWAPKDVPVKIKSQQEFVNKVGEELPREINPVKATVVTFQVIKEKVTKGEVGNIKSELPEDIERLWSGEIKIDNAENEKTYNKMEKW